jgi:hypothetical protein
LLECILLCGITRHIVAPVTFFGAYLRALKFTCAEISFVSTRLIQRSCVLLLSRVVEQE